MKRQNWARNMLSQQNRIGGIKTKEALMQDKSLYGQGEIKQAAQPSAVEHNPHHPAQPTWVLFQ